MNRSASVSPTTAAIEAAIRAIPPGRVSTYGRIAASVGLTSGARVVVRVLHSRALVAALPWHRVLARGKSPAYARIALSDAGFAEQAAALRAEGVTVAADGTVDFREFGWPPA